MGLLIMVNNSKIKFRKVCIVLLMVILTVLCSACGGEEETKGTASEPGVNSIKFIENSNGYTELHITYFGLTGYSVTSDDEVVKPELWGGETRREKCASLGQYRVGIKLTDTKLSESFKQKYAPNQVHNITDGVKAFNGNLNVFVTYPADDSLIYIIIGSDSPLFAEEKNFTKVEETGVITIQLTSKN